MTDWSKRKLPAGFNLLKISADYRLQVTGLKGSCKVTMVTIVAMSVGESVG